MALAAGECFEEIETIEDGGYPGMRVASEFWPPPIAKSPMKKKKRKKEGRKRFDRRVCQVLAPHMTVRNPRRIRGAQSRVYSRPTIHRDESLFNQTVVVRSNNRDKALSRAGYAARFLRRSRKKTRVHRPTRMFRGVEHR